MVDGFIVENEECLVTVILSKKCLYSKYWQYVECWECSIRINEFDGSRMVITALTRFTNGWTFLTIDCSLQREPRSDHWSHGPWLGHHHDGQGSWISSASSAPRTFGVESCTRITRHHDALGVLRGAWGRLVPCKSSDFDGKLAGWTDFSTYDIQWEDLVVTVRDGDDLKPLGDAWG